MRRALAVLLLVIAPIAAANDAEIAKGLENLEKILALAHTARQSMVDPWGTAYRVDIASKRIVGAGSDRKFDEATWRTPAQFGGLQGDVVFENGTFTRTNHNWLCARVVPGGASESRLEAFRKAEGFVLAMRTAGMQKAMGLQMTANAIEVAAAQVRKHIAATGSVVGFSLPQEVHDAWGTPLRVYIERQTYRIVSAGADRKFEPRTWSSPPGFDPAEDMVYENGRFKRRVDEREVLSRSDMTAEPMRQPPDASFAKAGWSQVDKTMTPPQIVQRVQPEYPDDYQRVRISGIVMLELALSATGAIENIAVRRSLGPALDMAAVDAVRKWRIRPATSAGKPVPVLFYVTINFKLE